MLGLRLSAAKKFAARIWEATYNFITSDSKIFHTSDGDIFNTL